MNGDVRALHAALDRIEQAAKHRQGATLSAEEAEAILEEMDRLEWLALSVKPAPEVQQ